MNEEEENTGITASLFWAVQIAYVVAALVFLIINVFRMNFRNVSQLVTVVGAVRWHGSGRWHQPLLFHTLQQR